MCGKKGDISETQPWYRDRFHYFNMQMKHSGAFWDVKDRKRYRLFITAVLGTFQKGKKKKKLAMA